MGPPHENAKACPVNAVGAGHWPSRRGASAIPEPTLIRLASLGTFPLEGGRLAGGHMGPPLRRIWKRFLLFRRGRTLAGPPVNGLLSELRRRGHTPGWLLSAFGRFTFSPSPTTCPERFQFFVGELLGAPAGACRGHPHPSGLTASYLPPRRGKALRAAVSRPYSGKRPRDVGSETAGAEAETHQLQFSSRSGPQWGRMGPRSSTPDFARRKDSAWPKG